MNIHPIYISNIQSYYDYYTYLFTDVFENSLFIYFYICFVIHKFSYKFIGLSIGMVNFEIANISNIFILI